MVTLDANVFVRDADRRVAEHLVCHALLERLHTQQILLVEPLILLAEVAGPLSRLYGDPMRGRVYVDILCDLPNLRLVAFDMALAQEAAEIAADYALRGMDAVYIAVARHHGCTLITLDDEPRQRASAIIPIRTPAEALAELS
jgi:predicted nucleic acid-binding protein